MPSNNLVRRVSPTVSNNGLTVPCDICHQRIADDYSGVIITNCLLDRRTTTVICGSCYVYYIPQRTRIRFEEAGTVKRRR